MRKSSTHRSIQTTLREIVVELGDLDGTLDRAAADFTADGSGSDMAAAKTAVGRASGAIRGVLAPGDDADEVLSRAWQAIAQAQDCIREARDLIANARTGRERAQEMKRDTVAQRERARSRDGSP